MSTDIGSEVILIDEDGEEIVCDILFTYDNEDRGEQYVVFYDPNDEESLFVARYYEEGDDIIFELDLSDDEFKEAEEVLAAYDEDPLIQEERDMN